MTKTTKNVPIVFTQAAFLHKALRISLQTHKQSCLINATSALLLHLIVF